MERLLSVSDRRNEERQIWEEMVVFGIHSCQACPRGRCGRPLCHGRGEGDGSQHETHSRGQHQIVEDVFA